MQRVRVAWLQTRISLHLAMVRVAAVVVAAIQDRHVQEGEVKRVAQAATTVSCKGLEMSFNGIATTSANFSVEAPQVTAVPYRTLWGVLVLVAVAWLSRTGQFVRVLASPNRLLVQRSAREM